MNKKRSFKFKGFTLIELLIVVAIIAILAAIAVPNFLEAQTRAKVSRVKSDHRALTLGLESYIVDHNELPPGRDPNAQGQPSSTVISLFRITTPVAYISSSNMIDPFVSQGTTGNQSKPGHFTIKMYLYFPYIPVKYAEQGKQNWAQNMDDNGGTNWRAYGPHMGYSLISPGPSRKLDASEHVPLNLAAGKLGEALGRLYDATNGTKSAGDVTRFGGDVGPASAFN